MDQSVFMQMRQCCGKGQTNLKGFAGRKPSLRLEFAPERFWVIARDIKSLFRPLTFCPVLFFQFCTLHSAFCSRRVRQLHDMIKIAVCLIPPDVENGELAFVRA